MAALYLIEYSMSLYFVRHPTPDVGAASYSIHVRRWGIAGMVLSSAGILISLFGRGAPRIMMTILMIAFFGVWWVSWFASFITF